MEDDGILLNISSTPKVTKKPAPPKEKKKVQPAEVTKETPISDTTEATGPAPGTKVIHGKAQMTSSLFTSNPAVPSTLLKKTISNKDTSASNAPRVDSGSFKGIGIESDLALHLQNKFEVTTPTNVQAKAIPVLLGPSSSIPTLAAQHPDDVDVVVQAETGSGKTLTYLLPIVNRLIAASTGKKGDADPSDMPFGDRTIGTVGIILTPTRELAQQVVTVLTRLVNVPRPQDEDLYRVHWIVPGIVIGGDSKSKEKARLRKGINLLVSTPGRLLDHLENTKSFEIQNLRWLVLDEADRLLDLGFEESLRKIMDLIDERTKQGPSIQFRQAMSSKYWPQKRQTVLCSATLRDDVKELAGWSLRKPAFISGSDLSHLEKDEEMSFTTPNQLKQTYAIIPAKLRLVTLLSLLKSCFNDKQKKKSVRSKVIVFFSCCDSVDFHYDLIANATKPVYDNDSDDEMLLEEDEDKKKAIQKKKKEKEVTISQISTLMNDKPVFRLHGDLDQQIRSKTFAEFNSTESGILLCTDVAARGLDLPNVDRIIQYDVPTDMKDYVHRVGRTARLGKTGQAILFLLPSETDYVDILKGQGLVPEPVTVETILKNLAENKGDYHGPAQDLQNKLESYVLSDEKNHILARKALGSTVRSYATHPATEKHIFHVKRLHLGHLAKSFGLREAPSNINEQSKGKKKKDAKKGRMPGSRKNDSGGPRKNINNPLKRNFDHASEFAITSSAAIAEGPTTKKKRS